MQLGDYESTRGISVFYVRRTRIIQISQGKMDIANLTMYYRTYIGLTR